MTKHLLISLISALSVIGFMPSCSIDKETEEWERMTWLIYTPELQNSNIIDVPAAGQTYRFVCTNYSYFWICDAEIIDGDTTHYHPHETFEALTAPGLQVKVADNVCTVTVEPSPSGAAREIDLTLQAGNTFSHFVFRQ